MTTQASVSPTWQFAFVHGSMHGAWCWYKSRTRLETLGHKITCLDLTSSGRDPTDANTVFTFADYNKSLIDFMSALSDDEKVETILEKKKKKKVEKLRLNPVAEPKNLP